MDVQSIIKNLHPLEIRLLRAYKPGTELTADKLEKELDYKPGHANQAFSWLGGKELVTEIRRETNTFFEITELGRIFAVKGTPEERILSLLKEKGAHSLPEISSALELENKDVGSAFGLLSKEGAVSMDENKKASFVEMPKDKRFSITKALIQLASKDPSGMINQKHLTPDEITVMGTLAKKRGAADSPFRFIERETVVYTLTSGAADIRSALDAAGITHGKNGKVKIIGFDFNRFALRNVQAGYWDCDVQCSPRQAAEIASWIKLGKKAPAGKVFQKEIIADTATITDKLITEKGINADSGKGVITK